MSSRPIRTIPEAHRLAEHGGFRVSKAGFPGSGTQEGAYMANHLTPDEVAKEFGLDTRDVIRLCLEEHVPIYHGKIDKTLFAATRDELDRELLPAG
jgi:hypothetical protein